MQFDMLMPFHRDDRGVELTVDQGWVTVNLEVIQFHVLGASR
jgi:hypothetical protein